MNFRMNNYRSVDYLLWCSQIVIRRLKQKLLTAWLEQISCLSSENEKIFAETFE